MGKRRMKRILLRSVAMLASLTGPVAAADLAAKAPAYKAPPPVVAVYNWTGFYFGGNVGGAWAKDDVTWSANPAWLRWRSVYRGAECRRHRPRR